jgi:RNA polymerase primary sigma factor
MALSNESQNIVDRLYSLYKTRGYIREEEALDLISIYNVSLKDTDRIIGILLNLGVIFSYETIQHNDDYLDFGFINYESVYNEIIELDNSLAYIINYIRKIKPPQRHEFNNLYYQSKNGNNFAKRRIIEMNMRQAIRHALYFAKKFSYPLEECIQESFYSLILGFEKFDITRSSKFPIHITWWIRQSLYREILIGNYLIKYPIHIKEKLFKVFKLFKNKDEDHKNNNKILYLRKIGNILNCSKDTALTIFKCFQEYIDINHPVINGYNDFYDYNEQENAIIDKITNSFMKKYINIVLSTIPLKERLVIINRFGLDLSEVETLDAIGEKLGISRERVRQIELKAFRRLRHPRRQKILIKVFDYDVNKLSDKDFPKNERFIEK